MATKSSRGIRQVIQSVAGLLAKPAVHQRAVATMPDYKTPADVLALPTGFRPLDKAIGVGGLPFSHIIELIGPGITSVSDGPICIAARIASRVQRKQEVVTIVDMNHSFDPWQAERCGLIAPQLLLTRPDTIFEVLTTIEQAARNAQLVIVIMGVLKELLHQVDPALLQTLLRRLQNIVEHSTSVFLFVTYPTKNDPFNPRIYPAGFPLGEVADVRLWIQDEAWIYKESLTTAYKANLTVIKNRLAMAGKGVDIRVKLTNF